ncbi:glycoside hydrolase family 79 protein [Favolaschia claudopus]|uniref:Glycoside hydrolase family 79 protein n=1 Tax=Favolaschia claudopus TaxID=2862362 RepID=A0AAW0A8U3_9AGAR
MVRLTPEASFWQDDPDTRTLSTRDAKEWMTNKEREEGQTLADFTGTTFDQAIQALRKFGGDMDKAANSLLTSATEEASDRQKDEEKLADLRRELAPMLAGPRGGSPPVIDLTGEDDELPADSTRFRATTRSPHPEWQMVPVNRAKSEDDQLKEVMQASLNDFAAEDEVVPPSEIVLREGGRPIALRAATASKAYAALVITALFSIPQVRQRCAQLQMPDVPPTSNGPDLALWHLLQTFTTLDLGKMSIHFDHEDILLNAWETVPLTQSDSVRDMSKFFLDQVVRIIQTALDAQQVEANNTPIAPKLFHFSHTKYRIPPSGPPMPLHSPSFSHIVSIHIEPHSSAGVDSTSETRLTPPISTNDLLTRLSQTLNTYCSDGSSEHQLIQRPSEVVTFEINFSSPRTSLSNASMNEDTATITQLCTFPKTIHLDQFLEGNLDLANETREEARRIGRELARRVARRAEVGGAGGAGAGETQSPLETLRSAIHYYENVAKCDSPERVAVSRSVATKLKYILKRLETEVGDLDKQIAALQAELDGLWENPELMLHPYDLRAVLVHTGLPGRKQIYSYVRDAKDMWWKSVDYSVIEVPEELVLTDLAGQHLGAGPYLLMYSRRQSESEGKEPVQWPAGFVARTEEINKTWLSALEKQPATGVGEGESDAMAMDLSP